MTDARLPAAPLRRVLLRLRDSESLSWDELAELLQVPEKTVYSWRYRGEGPRGVIVGRHLRYRPQDVDAWLEARTGPAPTMRRGRS
jgi:excisionase family DNA binding protein